MAITYKVGERGDRPWGSWEVLAVGEGYIVKRLILTPHQKLSLQSHEYRSEHWVVASGVATVTLDDQIIEVERNQHVFIDCHQKHRADNRTEEPLIIIEVQAGDTLDEGDIIRYEDAYGRI